MSEAAHKAWRTRKKNKLHAKLSKTAKLEVIKRKEIQDLVATDLKKWWNREYLTGTPSRTKPLKCEICGESEALGLATHHIDPNIERGDKRYNAFENKAPLCGTCHNIITYKKSKKPEEIINAIRSRHNEALRKGLYVQNN